MALTDAQKNVAEIYGNAARLVRGRDAAMGASYDTVKQAVTANAADRLRGNDAAYAAERTGMAEGAMSLGLEAPPEATAAGSTRSYRDVDRDEYEGNALGWRKFFDATGTIARSRNSAQADAFDYLGRKAVEDLAKMYASMGGGGGGGGGRGRGGRGGGGGGGDDGQYPTWVDPLADPLIRGAAATGARYTRQAEGFSQAGLSGPGSGQAYGERLRQGMLRKPSSSSSSSSRKKTTVKRSSGSKRSVSRLGGRRLYTGR